MSQRFPRPGSRTRKAALLLASLLGLVTTRGAWVEWPVAEGGNGHFYQAILVPDRILWEDADTAAASLGGYLATSGSAAENAFLFSLVTDPSFWYIDVANNTLGPWLGGFQAAGSAEPAGGWQWVNGEGAFTYTNWATFEPSNSFGVEDRLQFFGLGPNNIQPTWNDMPSTIPVLGYLVESPIPESAAFATALATAAFALGATRRTRT